MAHELVERNTDIQEDSNCVLQVFADGLLSSMERGEKSREEVLDTLKEKFREVLGQNGDALTLALISGRIALNVQATMNAEQDTDSNQLAETIEGLDQQNLMKLLGSEMTLPLRNTLEQFPLAEDKSPDARTVYTGLGLMSVGLGISLSSDNASDGRFNAGSALAIAGFFYTLLRALYYLKFQKKRSGMEYEDFLSKVQGNINPNAIKLDPMLGNMAGLFSAPQKIIQKMPDAKFREDVYAAVQALVGLEDYLKRNNPEQEKSDDDGYRGEITRAVTPEMLTDYVKEGVKVLLRDKAMIQGNAKEKPAKKRAYQAPDLRNKGNFQMRIDNGDVSRNGAEFAAAKMAKADEERRAIAGRVYDSM